MAAGLPHFPPWSAQDRGGPRGENGATAHELMAIFGWKGIKKVERYTRSSAMRKMESRDKKQTYVSYFDFRSENGGKEVG